VSQNSTLASFLLFMSSQHRLGHCLNLKSVKDNKLLLN